MATPRVTKKQRLVDYATAQGWTHIGEQEWKELRAALPDVAESTMRAAGLSIAQPWKGVRQHTLAELEKILRELSAVYEARPDLRDYCRKQVIAAKDRARWASRNPRTEDSKREMKAEMVDCMLVWLDDPSMFPAWAEARGAKRAE